MFVENIVALVFGQVQTHPLEYMIVGVVLIFMFVNWAFRGPDNTYRSGDYNRRK